MATIQTKVTSDNRQHDEAFSKSKQQVYNYNKQVDKCKASILKFAKSGLGALGAALGVAGGAMATFNNAIKATQTTSDKFDITLNVIKDSVDSFFVALSSGNFQTFLDGLTDIIEASKEVSRNLDELGTKQIFLDRSTADYNLLKAEKNKIIYDRNSTKEEVEAAKATLREATEKYRKEQEGLAQEALKTAASMLQEAFKTTGAKVSDETISKIVGDIDLYKAWQKKYLDYEAQIRQFGINKGNALDGSGKAYWQSRIDEIRNSNSYKIANAVYNTSDKKIIEANGHYINARNIQTQMITDDTAQMRLEQRTENRFNKTTKTNTPENEIDWSDPETVNKYANLLMSRQWQVSLGQWRDDVIQINEEVIASEEDAAKIIEEAEERKRKAAEKTAEIYSLQLETLNSFSSAFSTLGNAFDSEGLNIAGIITQAIANIIKGYSAASAQAATAGPMAWAAFSVAGLAQMSSVIAQIHSLTGYAEGGIIGGNSYTGDRVLARVNSGEMILNHAQQARLFDMINMGSVGGGEVEFKIKGQELVGVLNNYNRKVGRVR